MEIKDLEDGKDQVRGEKYREVADGTEDNSNTREENDTELIVASPALSSTLVIDGGTRAWLQVLGSFLVFSNLWGCVFAFGSFQPFYQLEYLPFKTASEISWIGTIAVCLLAIGGVLTGPLFDLGHLSTMHIVGGLGETLAMFLLSLCREYYQILLTQGVMVWGVQCLALVGRSFKKNRAVAMAITSCGAPTGGIVYTLMFQQLIQKLGFSWTVRAMGFVMLGSFAISFPLLPWGASNLGDFASGTPRKIFDRTALGDAPFWAYSSSNVFIFMGYMIPFIYIGAYGQTELGLSQGDSLNMIIAAQATSIAGRLIAGYLASKAGVMIPRTTCALSSGALCIAWFGARSPQSFVAFACLYGAFSGPLISLGPSIFPTACPDHKVLGARLGMAQAISSIAQLVGAPIAGAPLDTGKHGSHYLALQPFSGLVIMFGGCQLFGLWALLIRRQG